MRLSVNRLSSSQIMRQLTNKNKAEMQSVRGSQGIISVDPKKKKAGATLDGEYEYAP